MPKYKLTYNDSVHVFDSDAFLLDGKNLQGQEYAILNKLVKAKGSFVRKDVLCDLLWNDDIDADKHNIKTPISQLRSKFGKDRKIIEGVKFKFGDQIGYHLDCKVSEINELTTDIFTPYKNSSLSDVDSETEFKIRKKEYEEFERKYSIKANNKKTIAITSVGGIGKTTFARILYNKLKHEYSSIGWIDYSGNLDESILSSTDKWQDEKRNIRLDKINDFFNSAEKKLLIIDNVIDNPEYNQYPLIEDGYFTFEKLKKYLNLDIIITTRISPFPGYTSEPLRELDEISSFELFVYYYDSLDNISEYNYEDYYLIKDIVKVAHNNSLLIELFAKAAKYHYFDSLSDLYEFIKTDRYKEASVVDKVRALYRIDTLSDEKQKILWEFAILPNMSLNGKDLESLLHITTDNKDFRYLVDRGWISYKGKDGCSMHDVIKESILMRSTPNVFREQVQKETEADLTLSHNHKSYCYNHNTVGFAPEYCFCDIHSKQDTLDELFKGNSHNFSDIKKRISVLSAIANHIMLSNEKLGYIYYLIGTNTYHKLGDKANSEEPLRMALECLKELVDYKLPMLKEEHFNYNISTLYIIVSYELAYALSSMGYNRLQESYELMTATLNNHSTIRTHRFDFEKRKLLDAPHVIFDIYCHIGSDLFKYVHYCLPNQSIINDFIDVCENTVKKRFVLGSISDYNLLARIMDHAAYIITIYNPDDYCAAEQFLLASLKIRTILHKIHSLKQMNKDEFAVFIKPCSSFFDSIYMMYQLSEERMKEIYGNSYNDMHFTSIYEDDDIKEYRDIVQKQFSNNEQEITQKLCSPNYNYVDPITSLDTTGIIGYYLLWDDYKEWLKYAKENKKRNIDKKDIIIKYFNCYSDSNYISSLQDLATTEDNLGYLYIQMNRCSDAIPHLLSALNHRKELEEREPKIHLSELSWTYNNVGELYLRLYETEKRESFLDDAIFNYSNAVDLRLELNNIYKDRYLDNLAWSYMGLWRCYLNRKDSSTAENYQKKALKIYEDLNETHQYDGDIKILNNDDPLSEPLNWVGNQSHFKPNKTTGNNS